MELINRTEKNKCGNTSELLVENRSHAYMAISFVRFIVSKRNKHIYLFEIMSRDAHDDAVCA